MARALRSIVVCLELLPVVYAARNVQEVGDPPRAPTRDDLVWEIYRSVRATTAPGGWAGQVAGDVFPARVTLPLVDGLVLTDAVFDTATNGHRIVDAPILRGLGIRAWQALELLHDAPDGSTVDYRLHDGTADRYWTGSAWAIATDPDAHWSTQGDVQANAPAFPVTGRELTVRARLGSTDPSARPAFYGASVAYGVRQFGDEDDALIRTLVERLRAELRSVGVSKTTTAGGSGAGPFPIAAEFTYDLTDMLAVFNVTDDAGESTELPGAFVPQVDGTPGTPATWTPDVAIADGKDVLFEFEYAPTVITARHRDHVKIDRTPAVLLMPGGGTPERHIGQGLQLVRDLTVDPPTAVGIAAPALITLSLDLAVISELGADVRRLQSDLREFLQGTGYRSFVSPETGRIVTVREITTLRSTTGLLSQGVNEARGSWELRFHATGAASLQPVNLTRVGGILPTLQE